MNDADLEMIELTERTERANEIAHARKRGYCIGCDHESGPHTSRVFRLLADGTHEYHTVDHDGVGPIGDLGYCTECEADYTKESAR